jgi:hypothetical protein
MGIGRALARGLRDASAGVARGSRSWPKQRMEQARLAQQKAEFDQRTQEAFVAEALRRTREAKRAQYEKDKMELEWAEKDVAIATELKDRERLEAALNKRDALRVRVLEYVNPTAPLRVPGIMEDGPGTSYRRTPRSATSKGEGGLFDRALKGLRTHQPRTIQDIPPYEGPSGPIQDIPPYEGPSGPIQDIPPYEGPSDPIQIPADIPGKGPGVTQIPADTPPVPRELVEPDEAIDYNASLAEQIIQSRTADELDRNIKAQGVAFASKHGLAGESGAIAHMEYLLGREMTEEEIDAAMPSLIAASPMGKVEDSFFALLMDIEDLQERRQAMFEWVEPPIRTNLFVKYGKLLKIPVTPPKVDPWTAREALKVHLPILSLNRIEKYISRPGVAGKMGPISGWGHSVNPWDVEFGLFKANMQLSQQVIGKFLEGGVLRKEDTAKYRIILPQPTDLPLIAQGKIDNLRFILESMKELYKHGTVTTTIDDEGQEVPIIHFPDLPWNPGSEATDLDEIRVWLMENQDHEYASEVMEVWTVRTNAWNHINSHKGE